MVIKKSDLPEFIVIILFCVYCVISVLNSTAFDYTFPQENVLRGLNFFNLIALSINLLHLKKVTMHKLILIVFIIGISCLVALASDKETEIIVPILFIINGLFLKDSKFIKYYLIVVGAVIGITLIAYLLGIYSSDALIENRGVRYYLGFKYTTYLPNYFIHLLIAYIAMKKRSITLVETVIILLINYVLFRLTDTKAVYYLTYIAILGLWIFYFFRRLPDYKIIKAGILCSMPIFSFFSIFLSYIYAENNYYLVQINKVLAGRLNLGHQGIQEYGLHLFGTPIEWETGRQGIERSGDYFYIDSSYLNIALTFGLITLVFVVIGFVLLSMKAYKVKNYFLLFAIFLLGVHSFMDPQLFQLRFDPLLLLLGPVYLGNVETIIHPDNW